MFIYMIAVGEKKYIGMDTNKSYKGRRWATHCREARTGSERKVHVAMREHGIDNCIYDVLDDGYDDVVQLALAEIEYIRQYDTYKNGLNSTYGGDGLGTHLHTMCPDEIDKIRAALSASTSRYNNEVKWHGISEDARKEMCSHLHTEEVYRKKSESLKDFYRENPDAKKAKGDAIRQWCADNREHVLEKAKAAGLKGAAAVSKSVVAIDSDGNRYQYDSKSEFNREHGYIINRVLEKTMEGKTHKGWKAWEIKKK